MADKRKSRGRGPFTPAVLGVLAAIGVAAAVGYFAWNNPAEVSKRANQRAEIQLEADRKLGPIRLKLKTEYPEDFDSVDFQLEGMSQVQAATDRKAVLIYRFARGLDRSHAGEMAVAPAAALKAVADADLALATALAEESPGNCAATFYDAASPGEHFSPATVDAMVRSSEARLAAVLAGRDTPVTTRTAVTADEQAQFEDKLRAEGVTPELKALFVEQKLDQAPARDRCRFGLAALRAQAKLPSPLAEKIYSGTVTLTPGP